MIIADLRHQIIIGSSHQAVKVSFLTPAITAKSTRIYYPFGSLEPLRHETEAGSDYRYGFNGMEKDDEVKSVTGSFYNYVMRMYDSRVGRFLSVDPLTSDFAMLTPYQFASNTPIQAIDLDGKEQYDYRLVGFDEDGKAQVELVDIKRIEEIVITSEFPFVEKVINPRVEINVTYQYEHRVYIGLWSPSLQTATVTLTLSSFYDLDHLTFSDFAGVMGSMQDVVNFAASFSIARGGRKVGSLYGGKKFGLSAAAAKTGTIYKVPGNATSSGKPYIGRHNKSTPQTTRKSNDGRDRTQAEIVDTYDASKVQEGQYKEQRAINSEGGVGNLDNKRNEVSPDRYKKLEQQHGEQGR